MVEDIGEILKDRILGALYVDRISGVVGVTEYEDLGAKETTVIHRIPTSCDVNGLNCGEDGQILKDLVPDSSKKSVIFFEDLTGANFVSRERNNLIFNTNIRMVAWINQDKIGKNDCNITGPIMNDAISRVVTDSPFNSSPYIKIKVSVLRIVPKTSAIFNRYTFRETKSQYLMFPFDYFAIDFRVEYQMNKNCLNEFNLGEPNEC